MRRTAAIWLFLLLALAVACVSGSTPKSIFAPTSTCALTRLRVATKPDGARVIVDGKPLGVTPLMVELPAGEHTLTVQAEGYAPLERTVVMREGEEVRIEEDMVDIAAPELTVSHIPEKLVWGATVDFTASAQDNIGVIRMALAVDGRTVTQTAGGLLTYHLNTEDLAPGTHRIEISAQDEAGNAGRTAFDLQVMAPATPTPEERIVTQRVRTYTTTIQIPTYPFRDYLRESHDDTNNVTVLWLDRSSYEASAPSPVLQSYRAVVLESDLLRLTFLPDLGGRLYQCVLKPTGQNIFYQNPVIKPSFFGPLERERNWWLAAGGMEWALPVNEHGYEWGVPWSYQVVERADQVSIILRNSEDNDRLQAQVTVTLSAGEPAFTLRLRLTNPTDHPIRCQFWVNAMLTLGSPHVTGNTEFILPGRQAIVHSTGDRALPGEHGILSWPEHEGRDLSWYRNWNQWLGLFITDLTADTVAAYNHDAGLGFVRRFPPDLAPGVKFFAFGRDFVDRSYTDDGSDYFELWGGPCRTFWPEDDITLGPGQVVEWTEVWTIVRDRAQIP